MYALDLIHITSSWTFHLDRINHNHQFSLLVTVRGLGFCVHVTILENEDQMKNKKIGPQSQFVYNYLVLLGLS